MIYGAELGRAKNPIGKLEILGYLLKKENGVILIVHPRTKSGEETGRLYEKLLGPQASRIPTDLLGITQPKNGRNIFRAIAQNIESDIIRPIIPTHRGIVIISPAEMLGKTLKYLDVNPEFKRNFCPSREMLSLLSEGQLIHCNGKNKKIVLI